MAPIGHSSEYTKWAKEYSNTLQLKIIELLKDMKTSLWLIAFLLFCLLVITAI